MATAAPNAFALPFTLPGAYLRQIAECVALAGVPLGPWLASAGLARIARAAPTHDLRLADFTILLGEALARSGNPALGLLVGARLPVSSHGALTDLALAGVSLRQALGLMVAHSDVRIPLVRMVLGETRRGPAVLIAAAAPLGDLALPVIEAVALSVARLARFVARDARVVSGIDFAWRAPSYAPLARELAECPVRYGASDTAIVFDPALIDRALRAFDAKAMARAQMALKQARQGLAQAATFVDRVRWLLLGSELGFPSLVIVARHLALSPRTLHRRLVEEGTSYRELLDAARRERYAALTAHAPPPAAEIALALGYRELANLRRARRRWRQLADQ